MWPNAERTIRAYLATQLPGRVVNELPGQFEDQLPVTRVTLGPGTDDGVTDAPLVDVESFGADRAAMWTLAEQARQALHALAGHAHDGVLVDSVTTATRPSYVDYGNPKVRRAVASYRVTLRR
jgi:hypothetical protein